MQLCALFSLLLTCLMYNVELVMEMQGKVIVRK